LLRLIINILLLLLVVRLLRPVFNGVRRYFRREERPAKPPSGDPAYPDDFTPYEIEDADYEDIQGER
jgi:hypothetical protein